jgi:hypothetical protein
MAWSHPTIEDYLLDFRSKGDLHRKVHHVPHPAAQLLHEFCTKGATIKLSNPPWTEEHKRQVLKRGPQNQHSNTTTSFSKSMHVTNDVFKLYYL